jgi:AcrR family transcriptional regulator
MHLVASATDEAGDLVSTADRIAATALRLFNRKGYASTTLTEIAAEVGISQGNLTYHFATKLDLAVHLSEQVRVQSEARRAEHSPGDVADDYVESILNAMSMTWRYGFLMRDRGIFDDPDTVVPPSPIMVAALEERRALIRRIADEGLFRADAGVDVDVLARSLWILSRHWMDHLREMEAKDDIEWADMQRGVEHHFALLLPTLTASGRRRFVAAFERATAPA